MTQEATRCKGCGLHIRLGIKVGTCGSCKKSFFACGYCELGTFKTPAEFGAKFMRLHAVVCGDV